MQHLFDDAEKKRLIIGKKFCYLKRIEEPFSGDV
jgi:hypothetical protein